MFLSVVFSFRNEENCLRELIHRTQKAMKEIDAAYELIFVNDSSDDRSLEILLDERKKDKNIKIINMSRRFGGHPCVMAGLKNSKGDAAIYMDADLQDPPELIPELVKKWQNGAEVVHTVRTAREGEGRIKMFITKMAYRFINFICEIDLPTNAGEYKLLSRKIVNELVNMEEYGPFLRGLVHWVGFKQEIVYYKRLKRYAGKTHYSLFGPGPIKEFERGIISFSDVPLRFALFLGLLTSLFSFSYIIVVLIAKFRGQNLPGWTAIMSAMLFLNGMILFTIGILGLYVARIYHDVKGRPAYIIAEKIGF